MTAEGYSYLVALVLFIFVVVVLYLYRPRKPTLIDKPILGLLDLSGGISTAEVKADRDTLGSFFYSVAEESSWPPNCDVLFVYCRIEDDGHIRGWKSGLRDLIRESGAPIVILASENTPTAYLAALKKTGYGFANIVSVIDRKGEAFGQFFHELFGAMNEGESMPIAFAKLTPHLRCPAVIFNVEVGPIAFRSVRTEPGVQVERSSTGASVYSLRWNMTEKDVKFRHILFNRVKSDTGFVVKIRIFEGYSEYREGKHVATIPVQLAIGQALAYLSKDTVIKWNPPFENEQISEDKKNEILQNTAEAMRFRGCPTEIV